MRKWIFAFLLTIAMLLATGCSADVTVEDPTKNNHKNDPTSSTPADIHIDVDFNLNINADEGKDADGFTWENNYSEITITGYVGASNELTVPNTINGKPVTQIKKGAMKNFTGLKSIVIPGSVKTIEGVFEGCTGLETVVIAEQGLEDMTRAFVGCTALKFANVPTTVTKMEGAFDGCAKLESAIAVPAGVASLYYTFQDCAALKKVTMHDGVKNLDYAFDGCVSLADVNISTAVTELVSTFQNCAALKSVQIPEGVRKLYGAFSGCTSLVNVNIPANVTRMDGAFEGCSSLQAIHIPANVTYMGGAFRNCTALETVTFAGEVYPFDESFIDEYKTDAFDGCTSLKKLELPKGIGLRGYGCIALEELIVHVPDNRYDAWEDVYEEFIQVNVNDYVEFAYLPALKKVEFVSDVEGVEIEIHSVNYDLENGYNQYVGDASWYETLLSEAQQALRYGYYYYPEKLKDGTEFRLLSTYDEDNSWGADEIPVTEIESRARIDNQIIYTCYRPALFLGEDGEYHAGVAGYKSVMTYYVINYRPEYNKDVCGTEAYADCAYSESITINGISYPVVVYE